MGRKSNTSLGYWSKEEREYCIEQYYLRRQMIFPVKRAYWEKFHEQNGLDCNKGPTTEQIREWVKKYEEQQKSLSVLQQQQEKEQRRKLEKSK